MNISENVLETKIHWSPTIWTTWFVIDTTPPPFDLPWISSQVLIKGNSGGCDNSQIAQHTYE